QYTFLNAKVGKKDPSELLAEIKDRISKMIDRKMDAIKCIQQKAEEVAENFVFNSSMPYQYYSSKWSSIEGEPPVKLPMSILGNRRMYLHMKMNNDTHFYNLAVNTSHSSVHVPTNVYDKEDAAAFAIQWSEALDEVFIRNYNSDPALSWQYFGSSSGIMRHYPAQRWMGDVKKDLFDCRVRTWFIEAATCTKDAIILMDNSGSMKGMGHHIGSLTASSILDTFSNNDYINVFNYSSTTNYTIPCFENMLVQATKENIGIFKEAISRMEPEGKTNLGQALEVAFELLKSYREKRGCSENSTHCNQAIMVITDGVNSNVSDIVLKHNYLNNGSHIPVRIFTYLVGKEVTNPQELKWVSCANRGYYTPVQTLEQVTVSVLQYISVIARPLVLQAETGDGEHPVSWTHAYVDITYDDKNDNQINEPYRLLTSVAIPCYDTKINRMNDTVTAYLLGVAGTDVPLDEFTKMTLPYKIGVNGYTFIVSNNGYVLMHPDLRPVFEGILKDNYNSIDLTQVEQHDDELPVRVIGKTLENLRQALVDGKEGSLHNIKLSYHYDDMKRISEEYFDYYYTPLEGTPFTIGIAIPNKYGNFSLEVGDEIQRNRHTGENLTELFSGSKWKIHPKWVYCKYHYLEGHESATPEQEWLKFVDKIYSRNFRWEKQYEESKNNYLDEVACGRNTLQDDDYYCDKDLVQRLIFDARNTLKPYSDKWQFSDKELSSFQRFNASLRFVATMSGLTRWDYIFNNTNGTNADLKSKKKEFGELHPRAINEKWYKSAVLQHQYDTESFVYSVPFNSSTDPDTLVTGSYAIFPSDGGLEAPGSVVGFQFSQLRLKEKVQNITTKLSNLCSYSHCAKCNDTLTCYIVDSSGYIIVSRDNYTGKFFGEIEGDVLHSMLEEKIFKQVTVFDYQALCKIEKNQGSCSPSLINPFKYAEVFVSWLFTKIMYFLMEVNIYSILQQVAVYAQDELSDSTDEEGDILSEDDEIPIINKKEDYYACETKIDLFVLQQDLFIKENFPGEINRPGIRNYYVKRIPFSNLIFVAINNTISKDTSHYYTTSPVRITEKPEFLIDYMNFTLLPCQKLELNNLPRRRLTGCYNEHPLEREIKDCGRSSGIKINLLLFFFALSIKLCI
ncbi:hypothetical protein NQ315_010251, partial [Exocentrus adspersus]